MLTCNKCRQHTTVSWMHAGEPCLEAMCDGILQPTPVRPVATVANGLWAWLSQIWTDCSTANLCRCYNWCMSPSRLMTDREHKATAKLAHRCVAMLVKRGGWHENEDGRLVAA